MSYEQYSMRREIGRTLGRERLALSVDAEGVRRRRSLGRAGRRSSTTSCRASASRCRRITTAAGACRRRRYWCGAREEHKKRFLTPICRGDVRTWQLLSEPSAGSDLAGIKTTAIRDGDAYVVNGQKMFVGSSHGADYSWTIVVTDPKGERHKNLSWLMIPMNLPGITVTPMDLLATGGEGGSGSGVKNAIFFDNVRVPADHLVGGENNGWKVATTHLEVEHGGTGRLADRRVVYEFIELCRERHDGYAIADDPDARAELVELYIEAEITRLFALRNHWLAHTGQPRSYEGAQYSLRRKLSGPRHGGEDAAHRGPVRADEGQALGAAAREHRILPARRDHGAASRAPRPTSSASSSRGASASAGASARKPAR